DDHALVGRVHGGMCPTETGWPQIEHEGQHRDEEGSAGEEDSLQQQTFPTWCHDSSVPRIANHISACGESVPWRAGRAAEPHGMSPPVARSPLPGCDGIETGDRGPEDREPS